MLNETEHLLACLSEECAEIIKRCDKALRFGIDDKDPTYEGAPTERARITEESQHFMAVYEMLFERDIVPLLIDRDAIREKKAKVTKFMEYAREHGALERS